MMMSDGKDALGCEGIVSKRRGSPCFIWTHGPVAQASREREMDWAKRCHKPPSDEIDARRPGRGD